MRPLRKAWAASLVCAALGWLAPPTLHAQQPPPSLASIPVDAPAVALTLPPGAVLNVRVRVSDAGGLARLLGESAAQPVAAEGGGGWLALRLKPGEHPDAGGPADTRRASFIVDYEDAAVRRLVAELQADRGAAGEATAQRTVGDDVVAFVARRMRSVYDANAALASAVARTLQGDCTEHALLTTALARALGVPARMVQGVALVPSAQGWEAYGHAWSQTWEGGRWTVRDSALAAFAGPVYYLPTAAMEDEGPGYLLALLRGMTRLPQRIEVVGAEAPAPR